MKSLVGKTFDNSYFVIMCVNHKDALVFIKDYHEIMKVSCNSKEKINLSSGGLSALKVYRAERFECYDMAKRALDKIKDVTHTDNKFAILEIEIEGRVVDEINCN